MTRFALLFAACAAAVFIGSPAHAATTVNVDFSYSLATAPIGSCLVPVAAGSDGVAVLQSAVDHGCISSYKVTASSFGRYLDCINEVCGRSEAIFVGTYWGIGLNGSATEYGVDGYSASSGDKLNFDYTSYAFLPV